MIIHDCRLFAKVLTKYTPAPPIWGAGQAKLTETINLCALRVLREKYYGSGAPVNA
jgi:hypothetical protein